MSRAKPLAVSYRRVRSFSIAFITIQSSSPRTSFVSLAGSVLRCAATDGSRSRDSESRVLGLGGSSSRIRLKISSYPACRSRARSSGVEPVRSSYSITPSAYTSVRVSTSIALISACSGDMYSSVPMIVACCVKSDRSVSFCSVALAMPKSMILGTGLPSCIVTSTFDGFTSR